MVKKTKTIARKPQANMPVDIAIGGRIRATRIARRMTQSDLGAVLGVTFQQIQKYENGRNRVSGSRLIALCDALRTKPDAILGVVNGGSGHDGTDAFAALHDRYISRMVVALNSLPAQQRHGVADAVIDLVRAFGGKV